ncbi:VOC family protein [Fretibacter rubidus]|uniref:VOC family protein n=1 Tax=Fretibacter rubidus TaxID=570162 RepID=UPI00352AED78
MPRVNDIRYIGYGVSDVEKEKRFYLESWKLEEVPSDDDMVYLVAPGSTAGYSVRLRQTDEPRIDVISWSAKDRAEVDALVPQIEKAGGKIISQPHELESLGGGYGFRFFDMNGFTTEVSTGFETREPETLEAGDPRPEKISHVVLHSPNHKGYVEFYEKALGFKVSDWLGDFMCFLRCNEWHHRLAILPGPPAFNHVAYDVPDVDAVMKAVPRLRETNGDIAWGPGRHTAGNNVFSYYVTPAGYAVEYTCDLEAVDDETWEATVHKPSKEIMDQWGFGVGGPETMPKPMPDAGLFKDIGI